MNSRMKGIYLLLGSNLGDSHKMLSSAQEHIKSEIGSIVSTSSIYTTKAWGIESQPDFLNQVIEIESSFSPSEVLRQINMIEEKLGRVRRIKWHSRIIDIDILYFGDFKFNSENLVIPHAEIENRNFVLIPMNEIAPNFIHPVFKCTQKELLEKCPDRLTARRLP